MKSREDVTKQPSKKHYASPRLTFYGAVRDLTAGGPSKHQEGHPDPEKRGRT
jgi:hypothetical protein